MALVPSDPSPNGRSPDARSQPRSRFTTTMAELEAQAHVPLENQVEAQATSPARPSSAAWDEERRQLRLAGGPM